MNRSEANKLFKKNLEACVKSAAEGDAEAHYYMGLIYSEGLGVAKDLNVGKMWIKIAVSQGSSAVKTVAQAYLDRQTRPVAAGASGAGAVSHSTDSGLETYGIHLVSLPGGTFQMGSPASEAHRSNDEHQHEVTLTAFDIMDAAVTQKTYAMVMGNNPSRFQSPQDCHESDGTTDFEELHVNGAVVKVCANHPVEKVSWNDSLQFVSKLNEILGSNGYHFKLPTEAQYEYAFRGGTTSAFVSGTTDSSLGNFVWYHANSGGRSHGVRTKQANEFGVYRSSVWEWSQDWYGDYPRGAASDPTGSASGSDRVIRGCRWGSYAQYCR
ncbi:MAG: SUMF1/EgtB/PvdO family nonheme iron enzyme, partial [Bdellovibrionia bacterium]